MLSADTLAEWHSFTGFSGIILITVDHITTPTLRAFCTEMMSDGILNYILSHQLTCLQDAVITFVHGSIWIRAKFHAIKLYF